MEVAILIVAYNGGEALGACISSVLASRDLYEGEAITKRVMVVDNASTEGCTAALPARFPSVEVVTCDVNLGFAGGNVRGWQAITEVHPEVSYLCLLNQDTVVCSGWLAPLVAWMQTHPTTGTAQSMLLLHDQPDRVNTAGNRNHFLAFGFVTVSGQPAPPTEAAYTVDFTSGAAVLIRAPLLQQVGLFEPQMFMYLEDVDLSWKLRQLGYDNVVVAASRVLHRYQPENPMRFYYELERNRWWLLLVYYKLPTLFLLAPALLAMEVLQVGYAVVHGRLSSKLAAWAYFWRPRHAMQLWRLRRAAQQRRRMTDREFLGDFTGKIESQTLDGPLLRYLINPLFNAYWILVRRVIVW